jgi:glyoxylase-like metal-dependent hydrolase (beta-lactamase superfamily II)
MTAVTELGPDLHCIDLEFQSMPGVIASYLLSGGGEYALVETGPSTTLAALADGLEQLGVSPEQIGTLLVTHIHLDHAGAAGVLVDRYPHMQVYVHEVGAPHLIDPSKLLVSATRIYGDRMDELWGEVKPVPAQNVHAVTDGDVVSAAGHHLKALYTPGHASHHVAYQDDATGDMFTGDVAGATDPSARHRSRLVAREPATHPPSASFAAPTYPFRTADGRWEPPGQHGAASRCLGRIGRARISGWGGAGSDRG